MHNMFNLSFGSDYVNVRLLLKQYIIIRYNRNKIRSWDGLMLFVVEGVGHILLITNPFLKNSLGLPFSLLGMRP